MIDEFDDRVLIGEIYLPLDRLVAYYGNDLARRASAVQFRAAVDAVERAGDREASSPNTKRACRRAAGRTGCWATTIGRGSRAGSGRTQARVAAMLLLTLRGTPTLYYGDEIGMHQVAIAPDQVRDPLEKNVPGIGVGRDRLPHADAMGRDGECRIFDGQAVAAAGR